MLMRYLRILILGYSRDIIIESKFKFLVMLSFIRTYFDCCLNPLMSPLSKDETGSGYCFDTEFDL